MHPVDWTIYLVIKKSHTSRSRVDIFLDKHPLIFRLFFSNAPYLSNNENIEQKRSFLIDRWLRDLYVSSASRVRLISRLKHAFSRLNIML